MPKELLQSEENLIGHVRTDGEIQGGRLTSSVIIINRFPLVNTENALQSCQPSLEKSTELNVPHMQDHQFSRQAYGTLTRIADESEYCQLYKFPPLLRCKHKSLIRDEENILSKKLSLS